MWTDHSSKFWPVLRRLPVKIHRIQLNTTEVQGILFRVYISEEKLHYCAQENRESFQGWLNSCPQIHIHIYVFVDIYSSGSDTQTNTYILIHTRIRIYKFLPRETMCVLTSKKSISTPRVTLFGQSGSNCPELDLHRPRDEILLYLVLSPPELVTLAPSALHSGSLLESPLYKQNFYESLKSI